MHKLNLKKAAAQLIFLVSFFLIFPYELLFQNLISNFGFFSFLKNGKSYDFEPFPLNKIANLQYKFLYEDSLSLGFILLIPTILLLINHFFLANSSNKRYGNVNEFILSYFPYFLLNYIFYRTYYFYCKFSKPVETVSVCESTDIYFYLTILCLFLYITFVNPIYLINKSRLLNTTVVLMTIFFIINLIGDGYLTNYPNIYVYYQNLLNYKAILLTSILFFAFKDVSLTKKLVIVIATWFYFGSFLFIFITLIFLFFLDRIKPSRQYLFEYIYIFYLIFSIVFSTTLFDGTWDINDLVNEFYSIAKTPNLLDYFPQYNYLLPILVKPILLTFENPLFNFSVLMSLITLISISYVVLLFYKINKKNFTISSVFFLGFCFNFYSSKSSLPPNDFDLINGNFYSLGNYYQAIPLRIYMYCIFIYFFYKYLTNEKSNKLKSLLLFLIVFATVDNPFVGFSLSLSYLGYEFIINYKLPKIKEFVKNFWKLIFFNLFYFYLIFFNSFTKSLFLFLNSPEFTGAWSLNYFHTGFHIFVLIINTIIFIFSVQKTNTKNIDSLIIFKLLIFNSIFSLIYFIYFIGRSHPTNLYLVMIPLAVSLIISLPLFYREMNLKYINIFIFLIFSNSIVQFTYTPSFFNYFDQLNNKEVKLEFLNFNDENEGYIKTQNIFSDELLKEVSNKNAIVFSRFGSIVSHMNRINGHSPLISNVIFSGFQCEKTLNILKKTIYDFVIISNDPYVMESYYSNCFSDYILPHLYNENKFKLVLEDNFYILFKKN